MMKTFYEVWRFRRIIQYSFVYIPERYTKHRFSEVCSNVGFFKVLLASGINSAGINFIISANLRFTSRFGTNAYAENILICLEMTLSYWNRDCGSRCWTFLKTFWLRWNQHPLTLVLGNDVVNALITAVSKSLTCLFPLNRGKKSPFLYSFVAKKPIFILPPL